MASAQAAISEGDPVFEELQRKVGLAIQALLDASEPDAAWTCGHCGHAMESPGRNWLSPRELQEQANLPLEHSWERTHRSTILGIAMNKLIEEEVLELSADLKVRRVVPLRRSRPRAVSS